ncbi:MAG: hypothetical protein ACFFCS_19260 [Candidatus Hodarchaeota archaeon]
MPPSAAWRLLPLTLSFIIIYWIVFVFLLIRSKRTGMKYVNFLAIYVVCVGNIFTFELVREAMLGVGNMDAYFTIAVFQEIIKNLGNLFAIIFIKKAFYKENKSIGIKIVYYALMVYAIINLAIIPFLTLEYFTYRIFINIIYSLLLSAHSAWLMVASIMMVRKLRGTNALPHVIARYSLTIISSLLTLILGPVIITAHVTGGVIMEVYIIMEIMLLILCDTIGVFFFLAWVMPGRLKQFYNRKYQEKYGIKEEVLSEEEILKQLRSDD